MSSKDSLEIEEIRDSFAADSVVPGDYLSKARLFDRWLGEYTRQQREQAWDEALRYVNDLSDPAYTINILPDRELITLADVYQAKDANPYRKETP